MEQVLPALVGKPRIVGIVSYQSEWTPEGRTLFAKFPELEELEVPRTGGGAWLDGVAALPKLRRLTLGDEREDALGDADLARLGKAAALEHLEVRTAEDASDAAFEHIGKSTSLRSLRLEGRPLSAGELSRLAPLTKLRKLTLELRSDAGPGAVVFAGMPDLVDLKLFGVPFSGLEHAAHVERLTLSGNISPEAFDGVGRMKSLVELNVGVFNREFRGRGFAKLKDAPGLRRIDASNSGLDDDGAAEIGAISQLEMLELEDCKFLTDAGFAKLGGLTRLRHLNAAQVKIVGAGLVALRGMPALEVLNLRETNLDGSGAAYFEGLLKLQSLDVGQTSVDDAFVPHLVRLPELQDLTIFSTNVTLKGLGPLRASPRLRRLWCDDLGGAEKDAWRKSHPNLNEP